MSWPCSALTELLGIEHPIIQAPMAGASNAILAATVSEAGGLGGFGGTDSSPDALRGVIGEIRERTSKPFIINLYADGAKPYIPPTGSETALKNALAPAHRELEAGDPPDSIDLFDALEEQMAVIIDERVPVFSTHFGLPDPGIVQALKA